MKRFIIILILGLFLAIPAFGADVVLRWDENTEADLAGYQILQSNTPGGPYTLVEEIPPNHHEGDITLPNDFGKDSYRVANLADGIYYWVLTAYDNEVPRQISGYSNEVTCTIINQVPTFPPAAPTGLTAEIEEEE